MSHTEALQELTAAVRPADMTESERIAYSRGMSRGMTAYIRKHGSPSMPNATGKHEPKTFAKHVATWDADHLSAYVAAGHKAGLAEVRRMLTRHGREDRLSVFAAPRATRKAANRQSSESTAPAPKATTRTTRKVSRKGQPDASVSAVPVVVPEPMPRMTRAARKASNRELAARMRAAGIEINPETWAAAKAGMLSALSESGAA